MMRPAGRGRARHAYRWLAGIGAAASARLLTSRRAGVVAMGVVGLGVAGTVVVATGWVPHPATGGGAGPGVVRSGGVPLPDPVPGGANAVPTGTGAAAVQDDNIPYDGRFIFLRVRYETGLGRFRGWGREAPWHHDYPRAEQNLAQILSELTFIEPYDGGSNILTTDDPELFKYPIAYISEPGFWQMGEAEVSGLRDYLLKGGFLIFDDFGGRDIVDLEDQMRRVLPEGRFVELDPSTDAIFNSFFAIENTNYWSYRGNGRPPVYLGIYEDNDPSKRLMVIANYNNDIGEYWEYSDAGWYPIDLTNEAYKLGVNYIVYAMTH